MVENDKDDDIFLGGILRFGYEILKSNLKTDRNESFFDFVESLGSDVRNSLEGDPHYKKMYQGADFVRKGKEFWDEIKKLFLVEE